MGGGGDIVEPDEMYHGKSEAPPRRSKYLLPPTKEGRSGHAGKRTIFAMVERGGTVSSFHVASDDKEAVAKIVRANAAREMPMHTDESNLWPAVGTEFGAHETVKHSTKEYARGDVTTNSVEGFFGLFARSVIGVYQHRGAKHLHRYLAEYDFRYNHRMRLGYSDMGRALAALRGAEGKRLTYQQSH